MKLVFTILTVVFLFLSCVESTNQNNKFRFPGFVKNSDSLKNKDILFVKSPGVIFIMPDSIEIENLQKGMSTDAYDAVIDDLTYYLYTSSEFFDSCGIKTIYCEKPFISLGDTSASSNIILDKDSFDFGSMIYYKTGKNLVLEYSAGFNQNEAKKYFFD